MRYQRSRMIMKYLITPLCIAILVLGCFCVVWIKSGLRSVEYAIGGLENKRVERLKQTKMLMAERASLLSIQKIKTAAIQDMGLVFPDRKKVFYIKKQRPPLQHKAALDRKLLSER